MMNPRPAAPSRGLTAGEVRARLAHVPDDYLVVLAGDPGREEYLPLTGIDTQNIRYHADSPLSGRITYLDDREHDERDVDDTIVAVVLNGAGN